MSDDCIAAVIPALNEETKIGDVVTDVLSHVDLVVVVDDGSTDSTGDIARESGAVVIRHQTNKGYDQSIDDGFSVADSHGASIVVTFDADGQHLANDIPRVVEPIKSGAADIVVGIRPSRARLTEHLFALYTNARINVVDPLCGFKVYRIDVYHDAGCFDSHSTTGTQLMLHGKKRGYSIEQVSIQLVEREDESRFGQRLEANWKIAQSIGRLIWFDVTTTSSPN